MLKMMGPYAILLKILSQLLLPLVEILEVTLYPLMYPIAAALADLTQVLVPLISVVADILGGIVGQLLKLLVPLIELVVKPLTLVVGLITDAIMPLLSEGVRFVGELVRMLSRVFEPRERGFAVALGGRPFVPPERGRPFAVQAPLFGTAAETAFPTPLTEILTPGLAEAVAMLTAPGLAQLVILRRIHKALKELAERQG